MKKMNCMVTIWGDGPGRPGDNVYKMMKQEYDMENRIMKLFFNEGEECIIYNPDDISFDNGIKIKSAERIVWKHYYYGKEQSADTLYVYEYKRIDKKGVRVTVDSRFLIRDEIINPRKFEAFILSNLKRPEKRR